MKYNDLFRLDNRTVAVVGAGSGIGQAVAVGCAGFGARVACLDLDEPSAEATALAIIEAGGEASSHTVDVRSSDSVEEAVSHACEASGQLDALVSTPGINVRKTLLEYTSEDFDRVLDVNLKGTFHVLQSAGLRMKKQGFGSLVMFSSIRSQVVEPGQSAYAATKAGIVQLCRTLAAELGSEGVRVNAVAPGVVETPLTAPIKEDKDWSEAYAQKSVLGRWAKVDELVGATIFLVSDASSYVTGSVLHVDGGWTAADGRFQPPGM